MNPSFPRRWFLGGAAYLTGKSLLAVPQVAPAKPSSQSLPPLPEKLQALLPPLEPFFTPQEKFQDVSRGQPIPHTLSEARRREVGLTRETWSLEIVSDPDHPASIQNPMASNKEGLGTALDFNGLMALAPAHAVRIAKVMTCLNLGCPLGMGIWEGIPLRTLIWKTTPTANLRRVFYEGFHNHDLKQIFRSSLPIGRVLEDYDDLPPVLVCYKLNGQWLSAERGGPVRMLVPEAYGFKSIKWLNKITLSNLAMANDTYIDGNNDIDSPLKTFAATFSLSGSGPLKSQVAVPVTGYAQVGVSGLSKVQIWVQRAPGPKDSPWPKEDPYFTQAPWTDAYLLPPPKDWGGDFPQGPFPSKVWGFDEGGLPQTWPMRLGKIHWAALIPGLAPGEYLLRSRTVDAKGQAQPMPRPFAKSGRCAIETIRIQVGS